MDKTYKQPEEVKVGEPVFNQPNFFQSIIGIVETVTAVPTGKPTNLINQFKIYKNGVTYRFYWYDALNNQWRYVIGT